MNVVAIITARGGSKGIPGKNLREVGGVSLVGRAIQAAFRSQEFNQIVLTTDCADIAAEGRMQGATVLIRSPQLATDTAKSIDAVLDALEQLSACGESYDVCVLLQPTSPLRTELDIRAALHVFGRTSNGSVFSVCPAEHHPFKAMVLRDGRLEPVAELSALEAPRQTLPPAYRPNGAIYVNRVSDLREFKTFFVPPLRYIEMDAIRSLDIDKEADLAAAEKLLGGFENAC